MRLILTLFLFFAMAFPASARVPLDVYALDATISDMAMSPDGKHFAYTLNEEDKQYIVVIDEEGNTKAALNASKDKLLDYWFIDNTTLISRKHLTTRFAGAKGEYEYFGAIAYDIETNKKTVLLEGSDDLHWPQLDLTNVIGLSAKPGYILMQALAGQNDNDRTYDIFRVSLKTGHGNSIHSGLTTTQNWFVDADENILAREDFSNDRDMHKIYANQDGKWVNIFENSTEITEENFIGLSMDNASLVFSDVAKGDDIWSIFHLSLQDGSVTGPYLKEDGKDLQHAILNRSNQVIGVKYTGLRPSYRFHDPELEADMKLLIAQFPDSSINIVSMSQDGDRILLQMDGDTPGFFAYFDRSEQAIRVLSAMRPNIPQTEMGQVTTDMISARDGLIIPTLLTRPPGAADKKSLPAVVFPHGGPEAYDSVRFDYLAQYFANEGYAVIQPNFRGSDGFGLRHTHAGRGKWGREMQDDVSDTLKYYVDQSVVDPSRVCIVGASYGGYSALAGGAYTPELYKCVIAIAPVSDLPMMLRDEKFQFGSDHWVVAYWNRVIGDNDEEREKLKAVSPALQPENFRAPVLLIHGDDDTIVPFNQSIRMKSALERHDKDVTFVRLKKGDHWLSDYATRKQTLEEMGPFLRKHLGGTASAQAQPAQ